MPRYPRHLSSFSYIGPQRYFLTLCTYARATHFLRGDSIATVLWQILRAGNLCGFAVHAYCFMPDHLHLLVEGLHADASLTTFVLRAKQLSGHAFAAQPGGRLWQRYSYERVLRHEERTPQVITYIINNPVRAGLAASPLQYPFWGSAKYTREELLDYIGWAS